MRGNLERIEGGSDMKNILFICGEFGEINAEIEELLKPVKQYKITFAKHLKVLASPLLHANHYDVIIFNCHCLDKDELAFLLKIANLTENIPILILATQIGIFSYTKVDALQNMVTLQKPFNRDVFLSLLARAAFGMDFRPIRCPRFITDEPVRMIVVKTGLLIPTRMRNYSSGGAFLEYRGISLQVGDLIQISLGSSPSSQMKGNLLMRAKVIWIRDGDHARSPVRGVGVQFLGA